MGEDLVARFVYQLHNDHCFVGIRLSLTFCQVSFSMTNVESEFADTILV